MQQCFFSLDTFLACSSGLLRVMYNISDILWHLMVLAETNCDDSRSIRVRERKERRKSEEEGEAERGTGRQQDRKGKAGNRREKRVHVC